MNLLAVSSFPTSAERIRDDETVSTSNPTSKAHDSF